jgi:glycerol-3-phosphate O-acyltransferase
MPGTLASGVRLCLMVAEEIEVDRFRRQSSELRDTLRNELRRHDRAADRAEAAGI